MQQFDIIIIGSGIGGLVCANLLGLEGYRVCVLEKNRQTGGALQTYVRDRVIFDSAVHYIGGLDKGQNLYQIFKYLGLIDKLKLRKMDPDAFDMILIDGDDREYPLAQGYENFMEKLGRMFPGEEASIRTYCETIRSVCSRFPLYNLRSGGAYSEKADVLEISAKQFIESVTSHPKLQAVLGGNNILYAGQGEKTPLYIHALILNSYIESSWKCVDGASQIAKWLARNIRQCDGEVRCNAEVKEIVVQEGRVSHVRLEGGAILKASNFISNLHPAKTLELLDSPVIRPAYRSRINHLENSISCFSLNLVLKKGSLKYFSHNYYWQRPGFLWKMEQYNADNWPLGYALFMSPSSRGGEFAEAMTILAYMRYEEVKPWENTVNTVSHPAQRGDEYESFKRKKTAILMDLLEKKFPGLRSMVLSSYAATPLSFRDYTGSKEGSIYGILKDCRDPVKTLIAPHTRLPNFYFTGQNLNLHGILGASITALATCNALLGHENIIEKIRNA